MAHPDEVDQLKAGVSESFSERREAVSVSLQELLINPSKCGDVSFGELYDALIEGDLWAFVRLPFDFDCSLQIPATYWRKIDQGSFVEADSEDPDSVHRLEPKELWPLLEDAIKCRRLGEYHELFPSELSRLVYFFPDGENPDEENIELLIRRNVQSNPLALSPELGFIICFQREEILALFAPGTPEAERVPGAKRGPRPNEHWELVWLEIIQLLRNEAGERVQATTLAADAHARLERRGVKGLPGIGTIEKKLALGNSGLPKT